jgi:hypothetical protein
MHHWHSLALGDALTAHLALERIRETFETHYPAADRPAGAAVYVRHESTGSLHCEVIAFFSPGAESLARAFNATPCNAPRLDVLQLIAGHSSAD